VPHGLLGRDREGRVVCYRSYGSIKLWELKHFGLGAEEVAMHHQWLSEKCLQAMDYQGRWVQIIDIKDVGWSQCMARDNLNFARLLATVDMDQYPERLGQVYIINAPAFFAGTFKLISSWLDQKTRDSIKLLGSDWQEELVKSMDLSILPRHLGGESDLFVEALAKPSFGRSTNRSSSLGSLGSGGFSPVATPGRHGQQANVSNKEEVQIELLSIGTIAGRPSPRFTPEVWLLMVLLVASLCLNFVCAKALLKCDA